MENASKALIIAGAILLAILIISLGIMIYNQAQQATQGGGMDQAELSAFNTKFLKYEGTKKGTIVKSMVQDVLAVNADSDENENINVGINGDVNFADTSDIMSNKNYTVKMEYHDGRIWNITLAGPKASGDKFEAKSRTEDDGGAGD